MSEIPTKLCTGPAHPSPTLLPLTPEHWHAHRTGRNAGQPLARCRLCQNWSRLVRKEGPHGLVEVTPGLRHLATELLNRCGTYTVVDSRHGLGRSTLAPLVMGETERIQRRTAQRLLLALSEQRKWDRRNGSSERFLVARRAVAAREERLQRLTGY